MHITTWNCKYHVVFAPKYRRMEIYGKIRKDIGVIIRRLCEQKGIEISQDSQNVLIQKIANLVGTGDDNVHHQNTLQLLDAMHKAGKKFDKVLLKQGLEGPQFRELMELLKENDVPFQFVPGERLNKAVRGSHQGVLAYISQIDYVDIEQLVNTALGRSENPLLVILDGVSDVRNLGAIARSLECAGGHGIIVPAKGGAAINADAVKASAGALMRMDTCKVPNLRVAAYYLKQSGFKLVAATEKTENLIYDVDMTGPCAIIMGSEGKGISQSMLDLADEKAAIPMAGEITSLNVSVASSILMYEAVRQRITK